MPHPLEAGTIRILKPDGSTAGTGFLVSKRLAVTCAHVVESAAAGAGEMIDFKYHLGDLSPRKASVIENGWSIENDIAILELAEKPPKWIRPIIMQSSQAMEGRAFQGLGYPDDGPVQTRWPQGNISGRVDVEGYLNPLLQLQGKEIDKGLSGSAVVDRATRRVIGMVTAYQDVRRSVNVENVRFAYAIPIETIWKVFPALEQELPPLPKRSPLVEGIHLLPHGYDFRIQNFLTEYMGTPEQPEPFGGREHALNQLDEWLDSETQRFLLAAPAGRGKSALLVRWLDRLISRDDLALVFVPVSVRFRTNLSSTFFASLGARLAYLHGEDVPTSETTVDVWRGLVSTYLTKPLADEKKVVIVLDGLDEAGDWEATADLIPANLPKNMRIIVSARYLAGDLDANPWLSRLGWEHLGKVSTIEIDPLNNEGISDVLFRMGVPLDKLSQRVDIISELYRLSEGDPLLVNLYVEDLWSRGEESARLQPEDLQAIRPGYEGYFNRWWTDQKRLWGKDAPLQEKNVLLIFNLLCSAMGPLTNNDFITLDSENVLNTYAIEHAFDALRRFVISISDEHKEAEIGYVLTHPKLRDYFWERLTTSEQTALEARFVVWGGQVMQDLIDQIIAPNEVPFYILQYYCAHLERAHAPVEKFYSFVDHPYWHQAWNLYEGAYEGYLHDMNGAWKAFRLINQQEVKQTGRAPLLGREIRCMLIESSIHSLAGNIPAELLVILFRNKVWTLPQVLVYIRQIPDSEKQSEVILSLLPYLSDIQLMDTVQTINQISDDEQRAKVMVKVVKYFPAAGSEALREIQRILEEEQPTCRDLLRNLADDLPDELLDDAWSTAKQMQWQSMYYPVLFRLARRLPKAKELIPSIIVQIYDKHNDNSSSYISSLIEDLPEFIEELLQRLEMQIEDESWARVFKLIVDDLPVTYLGKALEIVAKIKDEGQRAWVLDTITRKLPEDQFIKVIELVQGIQHHDNLILLLDTLIKRSPKAQLPEVLSMVRRLDVKRYRSLFLSTIAENCTEDLLVELLADVKDMEEHHRSHMLTLMAEHIPVENLDDVLESARTLSSIWQRAVVCSTSALRSDAAASELSTLLPTLKSESQNASLLEELVQRIPLKYLPDILPMVKEIENKEACAKTLIKIIYRLDTERQILALFDEVRDIFQVSERRYDTGELPRIIFVMSIRLHQLGEEPVTILSKIKDEHLRAYSLKQLIPVLDEVHLEKALLVARAMNDPQHRADVLTCLADRMPSVLKEAIASASQINDSDNKVRLLENLAEFLPEAWQEARKLTFQKPDDNYYGSRLEFLIRDSTPDQLEEILKMAGGIKDSWSAARFYITMTKVRPVTVHEALAAIQKANRDGKSQADLFISLIEVASEEHLPGCLQVIMGIKRPWHRAVVLSALAKRLPNAADHALETIRQEESSRSDLILELAKSLPEGQLFKMLPVLSSVNKEDFRYIDILQELARRMPEPELESIFSLARDLNSDSKRLSVLKELISRFQLEQLPRLLEAILSERGSAWHYIESLEEISARMPVSGLQDILVEVRSLKHKYDRARVLAVLAQRLPNVRDEALKTVYELDRGKTFISLSTNLAKFFPETITDVVAAIYQLEGNQKDRAELLVELTKIVPTDRIHTILAAVAKMDGDFRGESLIKLAEIVPNNFWWQLFEMAEQVPVDWQRKQIRKRLARRMSEGQTGKAIFQVFENEARWQNAVDLLLENISRDTLAELLHITSMLESQTTKDEHVKMVSAVETLKRSLPISSYPLVSETLSELGAQPRDESTDGISEFLSMFLYVGPDSLVKEIYATVQDVYAWWP